MGFRGGGVPTADIARKSQANTFTALDTFTAGISVNGRDPAVEVPLANAAHRGLKIKGAAAQAANLTEWRDSGDVLLAAVLPAGQIRIPDGATNDLGFSFNADSDVGFYRPGANQLGVVIAGNSDIIVDTGGVRLRSTRTLGWSSGSPTSANDVALSRAAAGQIQAQGVGAATDSKFIVKGVAGQTANLQEWQDSAGAIQARMDASGHMKVTDGTVSAPGYSFDLDIDTGMYRPASNVLSLVVAGASQVRVSSAVKSLRQDLILGWCSSAGNPDATMDATLKRAAAGIIEADLLKWKAANEQTTVGAAGGASALPATPTKFLKVVDSAGTTLVVPAYAAS